MVPISLSHTDLVILRALHVYIQHLDYHTITVLKPSYEPATQHDRVVSQGLLQFVEAAVLAAKDRFDLYSLVLV